MKIFFEDYDKLRKGTCIEDKFISGLSTAIGFLSLSLTGDLIRYVDFVNTID
jgi:hypothetical protein